MKNVIRNPIKSDRNFIPEMTFVIAAHNEEELIEGAIDSILASDYPQEKIKILVGSDGSTDRTNEILENYTKNYKQIEYFVYNRSGKNKVLNDIIPRVTTDLIFFMDADCRVTKTTIKEMVKNFADETIGSVISSQSVESQNEDDNAGKVGDKLYHQYEQNIRENESIIWTNVNSLGYLYAVRKQYLKMIPDDYVCDDLYNIYSTLENKKRIIFDNQAIAREVRKKSFSNEQHRRVRAVAGGIATVVEYANLLNIFKYGLVSFFIISHKIFRWLSPYFIILLFILTLVFWNNSIIWKVIFYSQIFIYGMALFGWIVNKLGYRIKMLNLFAFFISMNYAALLGSQRYLVKRQNAIWDRVGFD